MVFSAARGNMHRGMQTFPQEGAYVERGRIPVDNSEFSTFSTAFSTRVFHSFGSMWIYRSGSHKSRRQPSPKFSLFRGSWILPQGFICAKNQDLTRFAPRGQFVTYPGSPPSLLNFARPGYLCVNLRSIMQFSKYSRAGDGAEHNQDA